MAWPKQYLVWIKHDDGGREFIANLYFSIINDNVAFIYVFWHLRLWNHSVVRLDGA